MAKPIAFGIYSFNTKKAATEAIRERISFYESGQQLDESDFAFFYELFKLHDGYEHKAGVGISYISVEKDFHHNKCLYIHRVDGTKIDISWVHCIRPASQKTVVAVAFRRAVKESIKNFKIQMLAGKCECPVYGTLLNYSNSHVAYVKPTFDQLLTSFLARNKLDIESIVLKDPESNDRDQRGILVDSVLKERWVKFHQSTAHLELWSEKANLRK